MLVACKKCNNEKRRDDQLRELKLAVSGWESFLSHDSKGCNSGCKTCLYWTSIWPDDAFRLQRLQESRIRIAEFRAQYPKAIRFSQKALPSLHEELEKIYRECQAFATSRIKGAVDKVVASLPH